MIQKLIYFKFNKQYLQIAIFASALNYVQEREEPVDFIEIFYDYEKSKDDLGITEDIQHYKQQKKVFLSPLKQKNQNNPNINNSGSMMNATVGFEQQNGRSNSVFYSSQNNRFHNTNNNSNLNNNNNHNNSNSNINMNKSQKNSKLSPLKMDKHLHSPKRSGNNNIFQTSQSSKNLKTSLGITNAVKGQSQNNYSINQKQSKQPYNIGNFETYEQDDIFKSALLQNNLSRHRLQQIEFYPSPSSSSKKIFNFLSQNNLHNNHCQSQQSQFQDNQDSGYNSDLYNDNNNPYSLRNGNHILKEHFNLKISNVQDNGKKYVLRKVNKPITNNFMNNTDRKESKLSKRQLNINNNNYEFHHLSTQTDDANAFDSVQQSTHSVKEQILFQSLKPNFGGFQGVQLGLNPSFQTSNGSNNQFINLNNLMVSINTPTLLNQQQYFNQTNFPKTAPSGNGETRKERGFQIKKFQNNNSGAIGNKPQTSSQSQTKIDSRQLYSREAQPQNIPIIKKNNKVKSDVPQHAIKLKYNPFQDDYQSGVFQQKGKNVLAQQHKDHNYHINLSASKTHHQFYNHSNNINMNTTMSILENNQKTLPLYCLNFNKTLEKRLLLNSIGI